jgi:quercetin dioxygenase-like cupin family protein
MTTALLTLGVLLLPHCFHWFFPLKLEDAATSLRAGQTFFNEAEGVTLKILNVEAGKVHCEFCFAPGAGGSAPHWHEQLDHSGLVTKGTLVVWADKQLRRIPAGERLELPRKTTHLICNKGTGEVVLRCEGDADAWPVNHVYALALRYRYQRRSSLNVRFHALTCVLEPYLDAVPAGWSPSIIKKMRTFATPYARLMVGNPRL